MNRTETLAQAAMTLLLVAAFTGFGCWWLYEGFERGKLYARTDPNVVFTLVVERKSRGSSTNKREGRAHGNILETGEKAAVEIFSTQYDVLGPGGHLEVYRLAPRSREFVFKRKYEESLPLIRIGAVAVSWHFPGGLVFLWLAGAIVMHRTKERLKAAGERMSAMR